MARAEWRKTAELIDAAIDILKQQQPCTVRQTFYQLVSVRLIENCKADYARVSRVLVRARLDGRIPHSWIVDRSRRTYWGATGSSNLRSFAESLVGGFRSYSRDWWQDQPRYVEVILEKDAVVGSLDQTCYDLGVTVRPLRGFSSLTVIGNLASELVEQIDDGKEPVLFYLGDFDPSGQDIERDLSDRLASCPQGKGRLKKLRVKRLAIFKSDIQKFRLPPLKVKSDDPRAEFFLKKHGARAVELDSLPPAELRRRVKNAIEQEVDQRIRARSQMVEAAEVETSKRIGEQLRRLVAKATARMGA